MKKKERYLWQAIFDKVKANYPNAGIIPIRINRKFEDPETQRNIKGYANAYAKYEAETHSVEIWAFTGKTEDVHDSYDGDYGWWRLREKIEGQRNKDGEWTKKLKIVWEPE